MIGLYILSIIISFLIRLPELFMLECGLVKNEFETSKKDLMTFYKKIVLGGDEGIYNFLLIIPGINLITSLFDAVRFLYFTSNKERLYKKFLSLGLNIELKSQKMQDLLEGIMLLEEAFINKKANIDFFSEEELNMAREIFNYLEPEKAFCGEVITRRIETLEKEIEAYNSKIIAGLSKVFEPLTEEESQASRIHIPGKKLMFVTDVKNISDLLGDNDNKVYSKRPKRNV